MGQIFQITISGYVNMILDLYFNKLLMFIFTKDRKKGKTCKFNIVKLFLFMWLRHTIFPRNNFEFIFHSFKMHFLCVLITWNFKYMRFGDPLMFCLFLLESGEDLWSSGVFAIRKAKLMHCSKRGKLSGLFYHWLIDWSIDSANIYWELSMYQHSNWIWGTSRWTEQQS